MKLFRKKYCHEYKEPKPHYIYVDEPAGGLSKGVCRDCGFEKEYSNVVERDIGFSLILNGSYPQHGR